MRDVGTYRYPKTGKDSGSLLLLPYSDYLLQSIDRFTSTPHQPANACFTPSLLPNVAENGPMRAWKSWEIKGLSRKSLKYLGYLNRQDLGS